MSQVPLCSFLNYTLLLGVLLIITGASELRRASWTPSFGSSHSRRSSSWSNGYGNFGMMSDRPGTEMSNRMSALVSSDSPPHRKVSTIDPATYYADWHRFLDGTTGQRCYQIPHNMSLCQNIGYNRMILPNFLQHEDLKEAVEQSHVWVSLAHTDCHPDLRKFLCALYAPICVEEFQERLIHPCSDLCEDVKQSCLPKMLQFGFGWPDIVRCAQFPVSSSKMCVSLSEKARPQCSGCSEDPSFESVISSYCMADIAIRTRIYHVSVSNSTKQPSYVIEVDRHVKPLKMNAPAGRWLNAVIEANCHCDLLEKYGKQDSRRMGKWIIMGKLTNDFTRFTVEHLSRIKHHSVGLKRAIRAMRQADKKLCQLSLPKSPEENPMGLTSRMESDMRFIENDLKSISTAPHKSMDSLENEMLPVSSFAHSKNSPQTPNTKERSVKKNKRRALVRRSQKYPQYQLSTPARFVRNKPEQFAKPPTTVLARDLTGTTRLRHSQVLKPPETEKDLFAPHHFLPWL